MGKYPERLYPGRFYHLYNRTNNKEPLFLIDGNRKFFLQRYKDYLYPYLKTYAYCLMGNHFHLLIQVREEKEIVNALESVSRQKRSKIGQHFLDNLKLYEENATTKIIGYDEVISRQFQRFFTSYSKAFNKQNNRQGHLFNRVFKRKEVEEEFYFTKLVYYLHANPMTHRLMSDFRNYQWSSYSSFLSDKPTLLEREIVLEWFGGKEGFVRNHAIWFDLKIDDALLLQK